jgi:hypothetical protein
MLTVTDEPFMHNAFKLNFVMLNVVMLPVMAHFKVLAFQLQRKVYRQLLIG